MKHMMMVPHLSTIEQAAIPGSLVTIQTDPQALTVTAKSLTWCHNRTSQLLKSIGDFTC